MSRIIQVLIADDHPLFCKGLADILEDEPDISITGQASTGEESIKLVRELKPDIAILDIGMPSKNGLDVAEFIQKNQIPTKVVILTMYKDEQRFNRAITLGIKGYILKDNTIEEVTKCIRMVANDQLYISPSLSAYLLNRIKKHDKAGIGPQYLDKLTPSERRILRLVASRKTSREIADQLYISIKTVENHRSNICKKLDLEGTNSLLKFAMERSKELSHDDYLFPSSLT